MKGTKTGHKNIDVKVLIVEDSPTQAELFRNTIEDHGYQVSVAYNGQEALDSIKKQKPNIVISDVLMPGMDGYQLCKHIKEDENLKDIIVILLTVLSDPTDVFKGLECGADDFIIKPSKEQLFINRIEHILEMKSREKAFERLERQKN